MLENGVVVREREKYGEKEIGSHTSLCYEKHIEHKSK